MVYNPSQSSPTGKPLFGKKISDQNNTMRSIQSALSFALPHLPSRWFRLPDHLGDCGHIGFFSIVHNPATTILLKMSLHLNGGEL
jgi:hypothetical protein